MIGTTLCERQYSQCDLANQKIMFFQRISEYYTLLVYKKIQT